MADRNALVTVYDLVLLAETDKALGLACVDEMDGKNVQFWIPKSQIDRRKGLSVFAEVGELDIPRWLAEEKNLEYESDD